MEAAFASPSFAKPTRRSVSFPSTVRRLLTAQRLSVTLMLGQLETFLATLKHAANIILESLRVAVQTCIARMQAQMVVECAFQGSALCINRHVSNLDSAMPIKIVRLRTVQCHQASTAIPLVTQPHAVSTI